MDAMGTMTHEIGAQIDALDQGEYGEIILNLDALGPLLSDEELRAPPPDVLTGHVDPEQIRPIIRDRQANGFYIPMQSPGQVILVRDTLRRTFWTLIAKVHRQAPYLTKPDLRASSDLVVMKTHRHELFHFYSDVLRQLFGAPFDPLLDEALAVAWARRAIVQARATWQSKIGRMNGVVYEVLMQEAFAYTSLGYRDWPLYADDSRFQAAFLNYCAPPNLSRLRANGVDLGPMLMGALESISGGYVEKVM